MILKMFDGNNLPHELLLIAATSTIDAGIQKKTHGSGRL